MSDSYVYVHKRLTDGTVFYVGQGRRNRIFSDTGRNIHWKRTVAKYGYTAHKIVENLSQQCALSIERALIKHYGRNNLVNLTDGGDIGPTGLKHSREVRDAQSKRMVGNTHTLGRKLTEEHKDKIRAYKPTSEQIEKRASKLRGRPQSQEHRESISKALKGRVFTDEWKAKISLAHQNRPPMSAETRAKLSAAGKGKRTGKDNPSYGIPKTPEQKERLRQANLGREVSTETRAKMSGRNNHNYDHSQYTLIHEEHGQVTATKGEFRDRFRIPSTKVTAVLKGRRKVAYGWRLPS